MKTCINCGSELEDNAKFCGECGEKQLENTSKSDTSTQVIDHTSQVFVEEPDDKTLTIYIQGIPFNLKLVTGKNYGTKNELVDFYMGETPVTQALWYVIMNENPSSDISNLNFPVNNITPSHATSFLVKLNKLTGVKFDLPTKEQWYFAYQGGNESKGYKYSGSNDLSEISWRDGKLHPVAGLYPNELGLTDMEGNVEELLKGGQWALISKDAKKKLKDDNLSSLRIVLNIPLLELSETENSPLKDAISQQQKKCFIGEIKSLKKSGKKKRKKD